MEDQSFDRSKLKCFKDLNTFASLSSKKRNGQRGLGLQCLQIPRIPALFPDTLQSRCIQRLCKCVRSKSFNLKGKKTHFQFYSGESPILHAKFKASSRRSSIGIAKGTNSHISSKNFEAILLYGNDYCDYSLRMGSSINHDKLTIQFRNVDLGKPREMNVFYYNDHSSPPIQFTNDKPDVDGDGNWVVDLGSESTLSSIKNCCLLDDLNNRVIFIRKTGNNCLEIQAKCAFDDYCLFALSIASFLCKK